MGQIYFARSLSPTLEPMPADCCLSRAHSFAKALGGCRFAMHTGYMTVSELGTESIVIGIIALGTALFRVSMSLGSLPGHD